MEVIPDAQVREMDALSGRSIRTSRLIMQRARLKALEAGAVA
jgi:hypothetical protein